MPRTLIRLLISGLVLILFMIHSAGWLPLRLLDTIENFTYDARILLTMPRTLDPRVVIIDIDEKSLAAEGQWQSWTRDKFAALVNNAFDKYGVAVLGFDFFFPEPDRRSGLDLLERLAQKELADLSGFSQRLEGLRPQLDYDGQFAAAMRGRPVVLGTFMKNFVAPGEAAEVGALCQPVMDETAVKQYSVEFPAPIGFGGNITALQDATPFCGYTDTTTDTDGVNRRVPLLQKYKGVLYGSLDLALVNLATGNKGVALEFDPPEARGSLNLERVRVGGLTAPVDGSAAVYVPYRGPVFSFPYISATDVIRGTADSAKLKGTIALVGASAAGLRDIRVTPVGNVFPGVEVHANIVSGFLDGRIKQKAPYYLGIEIVLLVVIGLTLALLFPRLSPLGSASVAAALLVLVTVLAFGLWSANFIMPMGVPIAYTLSVFLAQLLYGYFIESRKARDISKMFGEYVPPEVVAEMADKGGQISMEGESREMTVLFSDVRGFTSVSEKLEAKDLAQMMNIFLTKQTSVIQKHRGTIDKYIGDAIMAFWGAPLADDQHAVHGMNAAMEMMKAVRELDDEFEKRGWPRLNIGVGLNTGKMNVGNMGSEFRRAYTVMGDSVNLGARLEGLTKEYGVGVLVSEFTRGQAPSDWSFREVDVVRVKGKNEPVPIYEPMGPKDALDPAVRQDLARQRGAMKLYREQKWDDAEQEFFTLKTGDNPQPIYDIFLERILWLRENPPGKSWDGAFTFTHK
ncbi:MAG: adenylate/guanylate cyclase domain-containing protein [Pseudomonadota bacterium]